MKKVIFAVMLLCLIPSLAQAEGYYFHYDHLGSVDVVTNEEGEVVAEYDYLPFGELYEERIYDEDFLNSYEFTGQESDDETGLYYYGARYYGAEVGRFMAQDPAVYDERVFEMLQDPQSFNAYAYVRNNPVKYVDPNGEMPKFCWRRVANALNTIGYDISATLLNIAIDGSISNNGGVQKFYEGSNVTKEIRQSNVYQEKVLGGIYAAIDSGTMYGSFEDNNSIEFNGGDLGKAFHGMTGGGWRAVEQGDGSYNIYIIMEDVYNFKYEEATWYDAVGWGNNEAYRDQEEGDLTNYDIKIYMEESYNLSSEDN